MAKRKRPQMQGRGDAAVIVVATVARLILAVDLSAVGFYALVQTGLISLQ